MNASASYASMVIGGMFLSELKGAIYELRWMEICLCLLIFIDIYYGLLDNVGRKHESFHFNLCGRRTATKYIEYNTYLVFGMVLGLAVLEPSGICSHTTGAVFGLALALFFEADSIFTHFCRIKGIKPKFTPKMLIVNYMKRKASDLAEVIEDSVQTSIENKENTEQHEDRTQEDVQ